MSPRSLQLDPRGRSAGASLDLLRLRILGTSRHGQILDVPSARCSVGSATTCTLRLRAPGVRPVHCLILRSRDGYQVRSLATDTRWNGRTFREQSLRVGDRLQLGPIVLEVVGPDPQPVPPDCLPASFVSASLDNTLESPEDTWSEPVRGPEEFLARIERLERQVESAWSRPLAEPSSAADHQLAPRADCLPARHPTVPSLSEEALRARDETTHLAEERERLVAELAARTAQWSETQRVLEERVSSWETLRQQTQQEMEQLRAELVHHQNSLSSATAQWRTDVDHLTRELQLERDNFEHLRQSWTADFTRLEGEKQAAQARCVELEALLAAKADLYEQSQAAWHEERQCLLAQSAAHEASCRELEQAVQQLRDERELRTRPTTGPRTDSSGPTGETPRVPLLPDTFDHEPADRANPADSMSHRRQESRRSELRWLARQWADRDPGAETEREGTESDVPTPVTIAETTPAADLPVRIDPTDTPVEESNPEEEPPREGTPPATTAGEPDADEMPLGDDDVFDRLRRAGIWRQTDSMPSAFDSGPDAFEDDDPLSRLRARFTAAAVTEAAEEAAATDGPALPDHDQVNLLPPAVMATPDVVTQAAEVHCEEAEPMAEPAVAGLASDLATASVEPAAEAMAPARPAQGDDDSIEAYMERLLDRMRGGAPAPATVPVAAPSDRKPISEIELAVEKPTSSASQPLAPDEYVPRSHAPELNANLAAMREIANSTRRTHLISHAHRTSNSQSKAKLLGAVAATSLALASIFYLDSHPHLAIPSLVAGSGMAVLWMIQALALRRKVFDALRLDTDHLHPAEDSAPAAEVVAPPGP